MDRPEVSIRRAEKKDVKSLLDLVKELAVYEHCPNEVEVSQKEMEEAGFGPDKVYDAFVAEVNEKVIGMAIFYTGYSTWKGKTLYLEDFLVTGDWRRKGVGELIFNAVINEAKKRNVRRMDWQVLDWNKPAIDFYKKYDCILDGEWINGRIKFELE